jgi:hypothetical protein
MAVGHGTRMFEIVFEDDRFVSSQIRADAARTGSVYALPRVQKDTGGAARVRQDVSILRVRAAPFAFGAADPHTSA